MSTELEWFCVVLVAAFELTGHVSVAEGAKYLPLIAVDGMAYGVGDGSLNNVSRVV